MADDFDRFLAAGLAAEPREPDRAFVARVQAAIVLEIRLQAERRELLRHLGAETLGVGTIAAAVLWLGRQAPIADFALESPAAALAILLSGFALLALLFSCETSVLLDFNCLTRSQN